MSTAALRRRVRRMAVRAVALGAAALVLSSCSSWRGVASIPLPGGPGTGPDSLTLYIQMPDTLALNVNSRVRVADVYVGSVRAIELKDWIATLTVDLQPDVKLPTNTLAQIGQTSLLGTQHVELNVPPGDQSTQLLESGDTIPLNQSTSYPTTERTLASISTVLRGGGVPNLDVITTEVNNLLDGNAGQLRQFLDRLDTFTTELNAQRDDITRAIDSTNRLLRIVADNNDTLDRVLVEVPPLIDYLADSEQLIVDAVDALGGVSQVVGRTLDAARPDLDRNLALLQRPLTQLGRASPYLIGALKLLLTAPFNIDNLPKVVRGDYINISTTFDLTLSTLDNSILTGTGFSGALRSLEQAWGRDPQTMIPDVRFTPHPNDPNGGPYIERGE